MQNKTTVVKSIEKMHRMFRRWFFTELNWIRLSKSRLNNFTKEIKEFKKWIDNDSYWDNIVNLIENKKSKELNDIMPDVLIRLEKIRLFYAKMK